MEDYSEKCGKECEDRLSGVEHHFILFLSECCMAQRFVVRAVALLSAKLSEKRKLSEMIGLI